MDFKSINDRIAYYLDKRKKDNAYRKLALSENLIDFSSNDYLGLSRSALIKQQVANEYHQLQHLKTGATGSRLLNGNNQLIEDLEFQMAHQFNAEAALLFNSGYNANSGLLGTVIREGDVVIYDESIHASLHEGIKLSKATSISFKHNNIDDLVTQLKSNTDKTVFVIIESVYSMSSNHANIDAICTVKEHFDFNLIVDEAHAIGVFGTAGIGLTGEGSIANECFARVVTFGKALGAHGAAILGSQNLKEYLINFCKPFIYSTALSTHEILSIKYGLKYIESNYNQQVKLHKIINYFKEEVDLNIIGEGPIFGFIIPGNTAVKAAAAHLKSCGFDVRPIVAPTVAKGSERLRISLHSFNTQTEVDRLIEELERL